MCCIPYKGREKQNSTKNKNLNIGKSKKEDPLSDPSAINATDVEGGRKVWITFARLGDMWKSYDTPPCFFSISSV